MTREIAPRPQRPGPDGAAAGPDGSAAATRLTQALRWAIDASTDPARAAADWLASDIDADRATACDLLTNPGVTLVQLRKAKAAYKAMRIVGETPEDRRTGARLYAASIAAALVWHDRRISGQSNAALARAFQGLLDDASLPESLRSLGGKALCVLHGAARGGAA